MNYRAAHIPPGPSPQRPGIPLTPMTLTIHSTGNLTSTAKNERDNLARPENTRQASFHVAVECLPFTEAAWHAGDGRTPGGGNMTSLSLEICESGDRAATLAHAAEVAAHILTRQGWGIEKLRQHHDFAGPSGLRKNCPRILRECPGQWEGFVRAVELAQAGLQEKEEQMPRYQTLEEIPAGEFRETVAALLRAGLLRGDGAGNLDLSGDMLRLLVILYRAGVFGKGAGQ